MMKIPYLLQLCAICLLMSCQNKPGSTTVEMQPPPPPIEVSKSQETIAPPPSPVEAKNDTETTYNFVSMENPPSYPGGLAAFYKFLGQNINYPADAVEKNVQGNVILSFVVAKDGSINDVKVEKKLGSGTDEEAIKVLKMSKKWNPGTQEGKPVRVKYSIPVKFSLN